MSDANSQPNLEHRIAALWARIRSAAGRAGRNPDEIQLVAVSKTQAAERVADACRSGQWLFGENRVEEAGPKALQVAQLVAPAEPPQWHMIGHLQSRKAEDVLAWAAMVHSVDNEKLARRLNGLCQQRRRRLPVLLEVNVSGEFTKFGLPPADLPQAVEAFVDLPGLRLLGLMTVAPVATAAEKVRPVFAALRSLRDNVARRYPAIEWRHLSMGMSDDFEVAIEEGATLVRIGRAIFGERG